MLSIQPFTFNAFAENTYVVFDDTREAVIIDPGCYTRDEQKELASFIDPNNLHVKYILNTHGHIDHVLGNDFVKDKYKAPLLIHPIEEPVLRSVKNYAPVYGMEGYKEALPDGYLSEKEPVQFGHTRWQVLFLPGHSIGHVGFYDKQEKIVIAGDVLFAGSIGRTDLPGGDFDTLIQSIRQKLFSLPDETVVFPGHGPTTTLGVEKISNPYCALNVIR
ncbi:MAG: MBL-fold metallo-hydrolase superfamily [Cytophagales bacterium]|jgi:glyoxylase-like metal-dependent hydrolase (beta-lactamase superfamily II)|nr:MBL fold metallo-hydrolase [Bacteroidota bacterium]MBS1982351.1 MBL fold metallo-hydrolase [Bacteroidota bacterium]WHZ07548.1 MAG: MBL-fold metallo-hydrolase superfamily [Cytophagales bacterium]